MRPLRLLGALAMALFGATAPIARSAPVEPPVVAQLGINLPTMGIVYWAAGRNWRWTVTNYFSPAVMSEIKNTLHADYVRTGFIPDWVHRERPEWQREDRVMDDACHAGLGVMVIVPTGNDKLGADDLAATVGAFFTRYTAREKHCKLAAEIGNENNLTQSPQAYAAIFESEAPEIRKLGIAVIAAGTSELDVRWIKEVSALIAPALPDGYGFHPYDVPPGRMQGDIATMSSATASRAASRIYITEYGSGEAATLSSAILTLDTQPAVTVYEYRCQPSDETCKYGLKDNPASFDAVARAFAAVRGHRSVTPAKDGTL
jgi:hypothetical protein